MLARNAGDNPIPSDTVVIERTDDGWKEVKLGAVYDLVPRIRHGEVVRLPGATTYTATLAMVR